MDGAARIAGGVGGLGDDTDRTAAEIEVDIRGEVVLLSPKPKNGSQ